MNRIRPAAPLLILALMASASATQAATEYEGDVPAEVVSQLLGAAFGGNVRLYSDAPSSFPPFEMPNGMDFVVGVDQGWSQRVILRSRVDFQASIALAYGALLDAGWQLVPRPGSRLPQSGFIDPNRGTPQTQLCHDQFGMLDVSVQSAPGATYVNLNRNIQQGMQPQTCVQVIAGMQPLPQDIPPDVALRQQQYQQFQQQLPRLELPNTDGMTAQGGYGSGGGSGNDWEVRATLSGDWNIRRVYEHFAEQIEDQEWERDARVIGDTMASGSWTKTGEEDMELVGNLTVLMTGENTYDLRFRMVRTGADANVPVMGIRGSPAGFISPIGTTQINRD